MDAAPASRKSALSDRPSVADLLRAQGRVLYALMLRDVRGRFLGSALGMIVMILWPLSHVLILILINSSLGRAVPFGESSALYVATGVVPFMAFSYVSRFTALGMLTNRSLLALPIVKVTDILFARILMEILSALVVIFTLAAVFLAFQVDFYPLDLIQAFCAVLAALFLGVGLGIFNGVMTGVLPAWFTVYSLMTIPLWISSGVLFVPDALPDYAIYWLSYNPALQCVEWLRSAYYEGYGSRILDKGYTLKFALGSIFVGLLLERLLRGRIRRM